MLTQAELYSNGDFITRWIEHDPFEQPLKIGQRLGLMEDAGRVFIIGALYLSLGDVTQLPPKAVTATILAILEEDGVAELTKVYPRISVGSL